MGSLGFVCPRRKKPFEIGIDTDHHTYSMVRKMTIRVPCPHCAQDHEFKVSEASLAQAA
jgi:hypothetical protein